MGAAIGLGSQITWQVRCMSVWKVRRPNRKTEKVCLLSGCAWESRVPCLTFHSAECIQPRILSFCDPKATTGKEHVRDDRNGTAFLKSISSSLNDLVGVFTLVRLRPLNWETIVVLL